MLIRRIILAAVVVFLGAPFFSYAASQCVRPPGQAGQIYNINGKTITYYVPIGTQGCNTSMQGCIATACPGLKNNLAQPTCLDAIRLGQAQYVTIASDWSNQGKYYSLGNITYTSGLDGQRYTVNNVVGYVHDTGCAFNGTCSPAMRARYNFSAVPRPDKLDVCITVCPTCTDAQASALAAGRRVSIAGISNGIIDPHQIPPGTINRSVTGPLVLQSGYGGLGMTTGLGGLAGFSGLGFQAGMQQQYPQPPSPLSMSAQILQNPIPQPGSSSSLTVYSGTSTAMLLVQPEVVKADASTFVSWTSVNMDPNDVCEVYLDEVMLDDGNEGTSHWIATSGTHKIDLYCVTPEIVGVSKELHFSKSIMVP